MQFNEANIPEAYRRDIYQNMVLIWVQKNSPNSAMEWIRTLANGNDKDVLISMCCTADKASFPEQVQWASEMQGDKYRADITKMVLVRWCKSNVAEAKIWAQNSSLSETADKWIQESSLPQSVKDKWLAGK